MQDIFYTREKLSEAVYALAVGPGVIQERLCYAFVLALSVLRVDDFPEDLQRDWLDVYGRLMQDGISIQDATCELDTDSAVEIAKKIYDLSVAVKG
jgi:hypothetical protein